jgi:hypothetical protein
MSLFPRPGPRRFGVKKKNVLLLLNSINQGKKQKVKRGNFKKDEGGDSPKEMIPAHLQ